MYKAICFVGFISIATFVCIRSNQGSQENPSATAALQKLCEDAMGHFAKGENEEGHAILRDAYTRRPSDNELSIMEKTLSESIYRFTTVAGQPLSYELIDEKKVSDSLRKCVYLLKFDKSVMQFVFVFYRAQDSWKIVTMHYDANVQDIVK